MRLAKLLSGLVLFVVGLWLGLAELGVGPWDVVTGRLAELLGASFGRTSIVVPLIVLVMGMSAGVRLAIGTLPNVVGVPLGGPVGGPVGVGAVLLAFGIGPAVQVAFRLLRQTPVRAAVAVPA